MLCQWIEYNWKTLVKINKNACIKTNKNGIGEVLFLLTLKLKYDNIIKIFKSIRDIGKMNINFMGTGKACISIFVCSALP